LCMKNEEKQSESEILADVVGRACDEVKVCVVVTCSRLLKMQTCNKPF